MCHKPCSTMLLLACSNHGICLPVWQTGLDGEGKQRYLLDILVKLFHWWNRAGMFTLILENFKELFSMLIPSENLALIDPVRDM